LRATNSLQRAILEGASYAIISTTPDGTIVTFNRAAERMLGYPAGEVLNRLFLHHFHLPEELAARALELSREIGAPVSPGFEVLVSKANRGIPDEREWTYVGKDGVRFPVLLSATALRDENQRVTGYLGIASEIAGRKRAAEELRRAKDAAETASQAKSEFLAMMSHEIRTPMNAIIGMTELLNDTPLNSEQREFVQTVSASGDALLEIIDEILDFSKIEAGQMRLRLEPLSISNLLQGMLGLLASRARAKGLTLDAHVAPEVPAFVRSDNGRLRQVLVNLVGNGIKFTERGGVRVRVTCVNRSEVRARLRFEVRDTGAGIEEADQAQLFQPFTQLDRGSSRKHGGTGLGLAISRRIVELLGGSIGVQSAPGAGSVFWFEIETEVAGEDQAALLAPAPAPADDKPKTPASPPSPGSAALTILVAEDHEPNRRLTALMLQKLGYQAEYAANGREAVEAWERSRHQVILMDCQMPEMDGFEATREIRRREGLKFPDGGGSRVRVIALTANALAGDHERCLAAGMDAYVSKPLHLDALKAALASASPASSSQPRAGEPRPQLRIEAAIAQLRQELDDESARELIKVFLEDTPVRLTEIRTLSASPAEKAFGRVAHSLAGSAGIFGLADMAGLALKLESLSAGGGQPDVAPIIDELDRLFKIHCPELEQIWAAIPASPAAGGDSV
jgi:PAS domain S-box-containing protein